MNARTQKAERKILADNLAENFAEGLVPGISDLDAGNFRMVDREQANLFLDADERGLQTLILVKSETPFGFEHYTLVEIRS